MVLLQLPSPALSPLTHSIAILLQIRLLQQLLHQKPARSIPIPLTKAKHFISSVSISSATAELYLRPFPVWVPSPTPGPALGDLSKCPVILKCFPQATCWLRWMLEWTPQSHSKLLMPQPRKATFAKRTWSYSGTEGKSWDNSVLPQVCVQLSPLLWCIHTTGAEQTSGANSNTAFWRFI